MDFLINARDFGAQSKAGYVLEGSRQQSAVDVTDRDFRMTKVSGDLILLKAFFHVESN